MASKTDWQGIPILEYEDPEYVIRVYEITPHPEAPDSRLVVRSWQEMLRYVSDSLETFLEHCECDELLEGVTLTFKLREMTVREYEEIVNNEC